MSVGPPAPPELPEEIENSGPEITGHNIWKSERDLMVAFIRAGTAEGIDMTFSKMGNSLLNISWVYGLTYKEARETLIWVTAAEQTILALRAIPGLEQNAWFGVQTPISQALLLIGFVIDHLGTSQ